MKTCKDVEIICTKVQYREATFVEKIKIRLHVLFCKTCKTFSKKNTKLTALCSEANLRTLPIEEKEKMKKKLKSKA
ncbi:hypothetical protein H4O18_06490 [Arenibacter sp. BSSL-BM3]|uniref:Glycine dehydrogenase n=1 Tax=Arenibacter arenosicollis TaxID=2762274 RepID=A0ABR7QKB8_9FLAO|nr:hypothetical protein [Arenibacter arenosicollis]MBC8767636.1 hypothetical protein [Arenibacter arenosicollis]